MSLLLFVTAGILLETMHGLKVGWYLDETYEVRRLMWTLAHAHGTLLSLVHIAFAASVAITPMLWGTGNFLASRGLMAASVLLPGGFALGGIFIYDGDPGAGVFLAPLGAALMWLAVASIAWKAGGVQPATPPTGDPASDTAKE
ncbi:MULTISPECIES: hypothetical protein [Crateriforma]|uniref:DUF423 domain-containing protein n=1 Tax=Crateriforma conspicua TaxID=2527996 RepID=A0A5C6FWV8_9PLAN|nr:MULTISPECIES: hypothetical protein [Crateriforma]TWU67379.1 hypothetical protein V7x_29530 [Crateriforma conspicua]